MSAGTRTPSASTPRVWRGDQTDLYEARGGRATGVRASFGFEGGAVVRTDLLERAIAAGELGADSWQAGEDVILTLRPFELVTLRITRG